MLQILQGIGGVRVFCCLPLESSYASTKRAVFSFAAEKAKDLQRIMADFLKFRLVASSLRSFFLVSLYNNTVLKLR